MGRCSLSIIIPAFNEEKTISGVVNKVSEYGTVIVVDDASTDNTYELAKQAGAITFRHSDNLGYEEALNTGMKKAYDLGYSEMITFDADAQHEPHDIKKFIDELRLGADIVIGIRDKKPRLSEIIFSMYTRIIFNISDPLCGMKAYNKSVYGSLGYFDSRKLAGTELALYGAKNDYKVKQVKIKINDRLDNPRFGNRFSGELKVFKALIKTILKSPSIFQEIKKDGK